MSLSKREFLHVLGVAAVAGFGLGRHAQAAPADAQHVLYDLPPAFTGPGSVSLLHMTDCHAQLLPLHFREPSANLGVGTMLGQLPHLVGTGFLRATGVAPGSAVRAGELIGYLADQPGHCAPAACLHWGAVLDSDHAYVDPVALIGAQPIVLLPLG